MRYLISVVTAILLSSHAHAQPTLFSGPQVGEALAQFEAQAAFGEFAGKKIQVLDEKGSPTILVFVHQVTRPSVGLVRLVMNFAKSKQKEGLQSRLVFLTKDPTETEAWFRRARRALPDGVSPLISTDGIEGPGAYGLNRKVTMTVIVADKNKVSANFAIVQPSIQADAPKIGHEIVKVLGGEKPPTLADMGFKNRQKNMAKGQLTPEQQLTYRSMIAPVLRSSAEDVPAAARKVEDFAAKHPWFKAKVHSASNMIINGGKLSNYGTKAAQDYLKKWSVEFAPPRKTEPKSAESPKAEAKMNTKQSSEGETVQPAESETKSADQS